MAWLKPGFGPNSDLLSVALGESGLNLSEHEALTSFDRNESGSSAGGSLSLESTSTPSEMLNWALYLSNPSGPTQTAAVDDTLESDTFESLFKAIEYNHDRDNSSKTSLPSQRYEQTFYTNLGAGTNIFPDSGTSDLPRSKNIDQTLAGLLSMPVSTDLSTSSRNAALTTNGTATKTDSQQLQRKDVLRLWATEDLKINDVTENRLKLNDEEDDEAEDEEDLGYFDTYAEYMPSKLRIGKRHPDPVVETSSLSSVAPPDIWYKLSFPNEVIEGHLLSALQLEAIVYACQRQETMLADGTRAGFLIGDGAGVGKGRTVAGIIFENYLLGRKRALWLSVSNDLQYDAIRDLRDIKCNVAVRSLNKFKYDAKLSSKENGSFRKGVLFATYSSLIGESQGNTKYRTRLSQIVKWCGSDYDGVIILDECHKAKNLVPTGSSKPTKTGKTVLELQQQLPKARVVYCSATGASEPKNMAYMSRLGIWGKGTPFKEFNDFIQAVERRGVGAMELVAMDMKLRGMYIARQLSFAGVTFDIKEVPLSKEFIDMYNASAVLWQQAREKFEKAVEITESESRLKKTLWGQFWAAHQRFFKYLCIASKVDAAVAIAKESTECGKCVVIGLQSTGEARTLEQLGEVGELTEFVSTAKGVFQGLIEKHFPVPEWKFWKSCFDINGENGGWKVPAGGQKKRKANCVKTKAEKRFKKEDLFGHSGLSGDEMNSDEEKSPSGRNSDASLPSTPLRQNSDEDDDGDNNSDSDSDDDNWLKQIKEKPKRKPKIKSQHNSPSFQDETSMDALAAAGINIKTLVWNKPNNKVSTAVVATPKAASSGSSDSFDSVLSKLAAKPSCNGVISTAQSLLDFMKSSSVTADQFTSLTPCEQCQVMKTELLNKLDHLGNYLPTNTLDQLMDDLGGPDYVAEMTGRKGRVVSSKNGSVTYESRSERDVPLELLNIAEKKRFMEGEKKVAIISEAASSGISLQADRRAKNQNRRVHITLELPWSADKAIQQFGRTHRSNQVSAPEYLFLISKLSGEQRFASIVAKRLESLGALTHGDRRATESRDLSKFNFDNKYGRTALEVVLKSILGQTTAIANPPSDYSGNFFHDVRTALVGVGVIVKGEKNGQEILDKDYSNISKFLNRLLGVEVELQNTLFQYFTSTLTAVIQQAKRNGRYDEGILDLGSQGEDVHRIATETFEGELSSGSTELHIVSVERGMSWEKAVATLQDHELPNEGFYLSHKVRNGKRTAILVKSVMMTSHKKQMYHIYRPNTGLQQRQESLQEITKSYEKLNIGRATDLNLEEAIPSAAPVNFRLLKCMVTSGIVYDRVKLNEEPSALKVAVWSAQTSWVEQYNFTETQCVHSYWKGNCKKKALGLTCANGLRKRTYHILSGSVLRVWNQVESVLATQGGSNSRMQIIRVRTVDGLRIVGSLIPSNCVDALKKSLTPVKPVPGDPGYPLEIV